MDFNGNYGAGIRLAPASSLIGVAGVVLFPVCGAMRRSHLIKE